MKQNFEIIEIVDNDDGTVDVHLEMDLDTLKTFASIGLMEVFRAKAKEANGGHFDSEGESDPPTGT